MFSVDQRDALDTRMLQLAEEDESVVAEAAVGSLAVGTGDRFSDLDLTFGIADSAEVSTVLGVTTPPALACLGRGLPVVQARGYDDLPPEILAGFAGTHVESAEPEGLRRAHAASVAALLRQSSEAALGDAAVVAERLAELASTENDVP